MSDYEAGPGMSIQFEQKHNLSVPQEEVSFMRTKDWNRIKLQIKGLKETEKGFSAVAFAALGVAISGGLGLLTWLPAYRVLPEKVVLEFAWVTPAFIAASVTGLLVAISCGVASFVVQKSKETTIDSIVADMESIIEV